VAEAVLRGATAGVPLERLGEVSYDRAAVAVFTAIFAGSALGAYAAGPVPVQWLVQLLAIGAAGFLLLGNRLGPVPGLGPFPWMLGWGAVVTLANVMLFDYPARMPPGATSPYPVYVALRFMNLLSFAAAAALVVWLLRRGHREVVVRRIVWTGSMVAAAGIYIYFAQVNGWWEPGRTRMGTAGGEQAVAFAYAFHRAMGTFREPSHFAEWLVLPFLLSFTYRARGRNVHVALMAVALLLTGSLTGMAGVLGGLAGAVMLGNPFRPDRIKLMARLALAGTLAFLGFNALVVSNRSNDTNLFEVFRDRIIPILGGGLGESNRGYVYEYTASRPLPFVGSGLGNAQLEFSAASGNTIISSFLNLYLSTWLSLGVVGIVLLALLLGIPVLRLARQPRYRTAPELMPLMAAYLGWLLMFVVHSEELTLQFGLLFGLVAWEGARRLAPPPPAEAPAPDA
jgi:O-Antigen ligase